MDSTDRETRPAARELLLDGSCAACLEGAHGACTGRVSPFGSGACSCQMDQHETLLTEPPTPDEIAEDERTCSRCGDQVDYLSTDDLCDGCVAEQETTLSEHAKASIAEGGQAMASGAPMVALDDD